MPANRWLLFALSLCCLLLLPVLSPAYDTTEPVGVSSADAEGNAGSATTASVSAPPKRPGAPRPPRRADKGAAVESTHAGWVNGHVYDAVTGTPVEGALVVVQEKGAFATEGRTVAKTDYVGEYRNSTDLGRVSVSGNIAGILLGGLFGPATKRTSRIDVTQLNLRVSKSGYASFEGPVRCREMLPENFSVNMEPVLLVPEPTSEVSTAADGWGAIGIVGLEVQPRIVSPGDTVRVVAQLQGPRAAAVREHTSLFSTSKKAKLHMSISSSAFSKRRSLELVPSTDGGIVFQGELSAPTSASSPSQYVEALIETSPVEVVRGAETKRAFFQVAAKGSDRTAARLRLAAADLVESGDNAEALAKLKELCSSDRGTLDDQLWLARASEQVHDFPSAAQAWKTALGMVPPSAKTVMMEGKEYQREAARWQVLAGYTRALLAGGQASSVLSEVLPEVQAVKEKDRPGAVPADLMIGIGAAHLASGDLAAAVSLNDKLSQWKQTVASEQARTFHRELRLRQAEKAARDNPGSAQAWADCGRALLDQGQWEEGAAKLQEAARLDAANAAIRRDLTYALLHLRGAEQGIQESIDQALSSAAEQAGVGRKAKSQSFTDWHTYAMLLYRKAYQQYLAGDSAGASGTLGQCQGALTEAVSRGRAGAAAQEYTTYTASGGYVLAMTDRIIAISGFASPEASCDHQLLLGLDALADNPDDYLAWYSLAAALLELKQTESGEAALQECLRLKPDFPEASYARGLLLLQQGDRAQAESQLRQVLALNPRHPYANKTLAQLYAEDGDVVASAACLAAHARVYGVGR